MLFYAAGVASIAAQNYTRVVRLFGLDGEPISSVGGPALLTAMLAPDQGTMGLTTLRHHDTVATTLIDALGVGADVIDDAWQLFEILRLATQLMADGKATAAAGAYAAANRRRDATTGTDATADAIAAKDRRDTLDNLAKHCHPAGLHLLAADKSYIAGTGRRWGSPAAERLAAEVSREAQLHPLVSALGTDAINVEVALRAVSHAVGHAADKHPANWVSGVLPNEIWLDVPVVLPFRTLLG